MKVVMHSGILYIFPNRGGRISFREGDQEAVVEGGIPYQQAVNALQKMVSLGVLIHDQKVMTINRNSIFLKDRDTDSF